MTFVTTNAVAKKQEPTFLEVYGKRSHVNKNQRINLVDATCEFWGYRVGDLVRYKFSKDVGIIYRILSDNRPRIDAVMGSAPARRGSTWYTTCWLDKKGKKIPRIHLTGSVTMIEVFSFMGAQNKKKPRKSVEYDALDDLEKVDIVSLGTCFASFQIFIKEEMQRQINRV